MVIISLFLANFARRKIKIVFYINKKVHNELSYPLMLSPWVWLRRFRQRCGYGVHSPYAFDFITGVIYEHSQYYAYQTLDRMLPKAVRALHLRPQKILHLLFRVANFSHPRQALYLGQRTLAKEYLRAAVPSATWKEGLNAENVSMALCAERLNAENVSMSLCAERLNAENVSMANSETSTEIHSEIHAMDFVYLDFPVEGVLDCVHSHSVLVVDHLRKNLDFWAELLQDERVAITFDLYDVGIIMFDKQYHRKDYIVNF